MWCAPRMFRGPPLMSPAALDIHSALDHSLFIGLYLYGANALVKSGRTEICAAPPAAQVVSRPGEGSFQHPSGGGGGGHILCFRVRSAHLHLQASTTIPDSQNGSLQELCHSFSSATGTHRVLARLFLVPTRPSHMRYGGLAVATGGGLGLGGLRQHARPDRSR